MNKDFEKDKQVLKAFLDESGIAYDALFEPTAEPPDVITKIGGENIGVELSEFLSPADRIVEGEFELVFLKVKEYLTEAGLFNLVIRIKPEKNKKIFRKECVEAIVKTCINKYNEIGERRTLIAVQPVQGIKEINAFKIIDKEIIITFDSRQRTYGSLQEKTLKERIEDKIKRLNKSKHDYPNEHKGIKAYWLLLTIEGTFYSNYAGVHCKTLSLDIKTSFDKIFVFHKKRKWLEEIKTTHRIV